MHGGLVNTGTVVINSGCPRLWRLFIQERMWFCLWIGCCIYYLNNMLHGTLGAVAQRSVVLCLFYTMPLFVVEAIWLIGKARLYVAMNPTGKRPKGIAWLEKHVLKERDFDATH